MRKPLFASFFLYVMSLKSRLWLNCLLGIIQTCICGFGFGVVSLSVCTLSLHHIRITGLIQSVCIMFLGFHTTLQTVTLTAHVSTYAILVSATHSLLKRLVFLHSRLPPFLPHSFVPMNETRHAISPVERCFLFTNYIFSTLLRSTDCGMDGLVTLLFCYFVV